MLHITYGMFTFCKANWEQTKETTAVSVGFQSPLGG